MGTLQIVFVTLASGLILLWLFIGLFAPRKINVPDAVVVLGYGSALRVFALMVAWAPPGYAIYFLWNNPWQSDRDLTVAGISFLTVSVLAGLLLIEVERMRIAVTENGLTRFSPWTGRCELKWSEVERVEYSAINRWFILSGAAGTIRISRHLSNVAEFVKVARSKLAAERLTRVSAVFDAIVGQAF